MDVKKVFLSAEQIENLRSQSNDGDYLSFVDGVLDIETVADGTLIVMIDDDDLCPWVEKASGAWCANLLAGGADRAVQVVDFFNSDDFKSDVSGAQCLAAMFLCSRSHELEMQEIMRMTECLESVPNLFWGYKVVDGLDDKLDIRILTLK